MNSTDMNMNGKLKIKKPFEDDDNEQKQNNSRYEEHKEQEEKPLAEEHSRTSEEYHGGEEMTESLKDSPNPSESEEQQGQEKQQQQEEKQEQKQEEKEGQKEQEQSEEQTGEEEAKDEGEEGEEQTGKEQEGGEISEGQEQEDDDEASEEDDDNDDEEVQVRAQVQIRQYNTEQVVDLSCASTAKYYQTEFARFIEVFAEEKTKVTDYSRYDEYNVKRLMLRQYEKKSLSHYRTGKIKDTVVLILDNSGSMEWWSQSLAMLAQMALSRSDVEIYIAPNGEIQERMTRRGTIPTGDVQFSGRRIIYVGDFDGGNTPVLLSHHNDVIWICPESRYRRFRSHDWMSYEEDEFRGVFIRAFMLEEMFGALKKISRTYRLWLDLHEDYEYRDDEGDDDE